MRVYEVFEKPMSLSEIQREAGEHRNYPWAYDRLTKCQCGSTEFILLPTWSNCVEEGGKRYLNCIHCGSEAGHL
jgi:hypothetical protein